jgi:hypothetical protein
VPSAADRASAHAPEEPRPGPLSPRLRIRGHVTDEHDTPIADAVVTVVDLSGGQENVRALEQTDRWGQYEVSVTDWDWSGPALGRATVTVEAPGLGRGRKSAAVSREAPEAAIDFVLLRGEVIAGQVVWTSGDPVPDAEMIFYGGSQASGQTDRRGRFRVEGLAPGRVNISVSPDGESPYQYGGSHEVGREDVVITLLPRIGVIHGRVLGSVTKEIQPGVTLHLGDNVSGYDSWITVTDAEGRYRFEEIPLENWVLTVPDPPSRLESVTLTEEEPEEETDIYLPEPIDVAGVVVEMTTNEPLPDFDLRIEGINASGQPRDTDSVLRTDAEGRFSRSGVLVTHSDNWTPYSSRREQGLRLRAEVLELPWMFGDGTRAQSLTIEDASEAQELRFPVTRGRALEVETVDPSGAPVGGAMVSMHLDGSGRRGVGNTDGMGRLTVVRPEGAPACQLTARSRDWPVMLSPAVASNETAARIRALPVTELTVHVVEESGDPVPDARILVNARVEVLGTNSRNRFLWAANGVTNREGVSSRRRVPRCPLQIIANVYAGDVAPFARSSTLEVDLSAPEATREVTIVLRPLEEVTVAGRVIDQEETAVAGAEVRGWANRPDAQMETVLTGPDGRFEITVPVQNGRISLGAEAPGYAPQHWSNRVPREEIEIVLQRTVRVRGRLVRTDGQPLGNVVLSLFTPTQGWCAGWGRHHRPLNDAVSDPATGAFEWALPTQGLPTASAPAWLLAVTEDSLIATADFAIDLEQYPEVDVGTMTLHPGLTLSGRVVDPAGEPLQAQISWESSQRMMWGQLPVTWSATTSTSGRFRLSPLPPGHWRLSATRSEYLGECVEIDLAADLEREIVLTPAEGVTVTVQVIGHDGAPKSGVQSRLSREGYTSTRQTDVDGRAVHTSIPPGDCGHTLTVQGVSSSIHHSRSVEVGDEDQAFTVDMSTWAKIAGHVTLGGEPVPQTHVSLSRTPTAEEDGIGNHQAWQQTATNGEFDLLVPPGTVRLWCEGASREIVLTDDVTIEWALEE